MIFVGDIACPDESMTIQGVPEPLLKKRWLGNLEGSLTNKDYSDKTVLFNNEEAFHKMIAEFPFIGFTLGNNHIFDLGIRSFEHTIEVLKSKNLKFTGAGLNINEAQAPIVDELEGLVIINFGWSVIQCPMAKNGRFGVNPLTKDNVWQLVNHVKEQYPEKHILALMHWNYELEGEPQPFERELAKALIDKGVIAVVGAHSHRVGGIEVYKDRPIVYSLGNWLLKQQYFFNKKLKYPDFCRLSLAFEFDVQKGFFSFHFFKLDESKRQLQYLSSESIDGDMVKELTPFYGLSNEDYRKWYKNHHYHKNKGLPIYYYSDSNFVIKLKNLGNKIRDLLLAVLKRILSFLS